MSNCDGSVYRVSGFHSMNEGNVMEKIEVWWLKMMEIFTRPVSNVTTNVFFLLRIFLKCIYHVFKDYFYNCIIKIIQQFN